MSLLHKFFVLSLSLFFGLYSIYFIWFVWLVRIINFRTFDTCNLLMLFHLIHYLLLLMVFYFILFFALFAILLKKVFIIVLESCILSQCVFLLLFFFFLLNRFVKENYMRFIQDSLMYIKMIVSQWNLRSSTNNKYRCSLFKGAKYDNDDDDTKIGSAVLRTCHRSARKNYF